MLYTARVLPIQVFCLFFTVWQWFRINRSLADEADHQEQGGERTCDSDEAEISVNMMSDAYCHDLTNRASGIYTCMMDDC